MHLFHSAYASLVERPVKIELNISLNRIAATFIDLKMSLRLTPVKVFYPVVSLIELVYNKRIFL